MMPIRAIHPIRQDKTHPLRNRLLRFDSLARLLRLDGKLSVCSAVTIVQGQLIIAANAKAKQEATVQERLIERFNDLRMILTFIEGQTRREIHLILSQFAASHAFDKEKTRALSRFSHAMHSDKNTFSAAEKAMILSQNPVYLTPSYVNQFGFNIIEKRPQDTHAEQLITLYCQTNKIDTNEMLMGISMLACAGCANVLTQYGITYSGTHGIAFESTLDITTGERSERGYQEIKGLPTKASPSLSRTPFREDTPHTSFKRSRETDTAPRASTPQKHTDPHHMRTPPTTPLRHMNLNTPQASPLPKTPGFFKAAPQKESSLLARQLSY